MFRNMINDLNVIGIGVGVAVGSLDRSEQLERNHAEEDVLAVVMLILHGCHQPDLVVAQELYLFLGNAFGGDGLELFIV